MVRSIFISLLLFSINLCAQDLQTPSAFLGYELGTKFTPHHRVMDYFRHAAEARPALIRLTEYGRTYEGRPLVYAVISSQGNMSRIESIRKNNLALTSGAPADVNEPVVVWLSYNVHGNEASSTEVSMKALYELLAGSRYASYLEKTVVLIDPCLNPDGRDRYVNWYNQVQNIVPDANSSTREHQEPWPGGRPNHYYFDLNRDWAWQTQVETRQRIKIYNEWMPAIHVDFHEQYPGSPYYFAPAAEPFHEVITPFQRDFQYVIGKNHARYFDAEGWLYFTKEYFDLFYPAYGDTYPIYNGAIGMTYEQAGHGLAGLAIEVNDDTLKLSDRIAHHFTTTMSTLEAASQNAARLNSELKKYFDEGITKGNGEYKTYIIRNNNPGKTASLKDLLARNNIRYGYAGKSIKVKGFNYFSGKEEITSLSESDIVISTYQPKAALVRVLFEPRSKLSDSATYDITAWALPYAYDLAAWATTERINPVEEVQSAVSLAQPSPGNYGVLFEYSSYRDGRFLAALLKNGYRVRMAERDFRYNGKAFRRGTMVVLRSGNEKIYNDLVKLATAHNVQAIPVSSGFVEAGSDFGSDKIMNIAKVRVAVLSGDGISSTSMGEIWHMFEQELQYPISVFQAKNLSNLRLKDVDVLILPNGSYPSLSAKDGATELKNWIRQGGKLIAMEGVIGQLAAGEWGVKMKKGSENEKEEGTYADLKRYENRERDGISGYLPGAIYKVELDNSHPLAFGYPNHYYTLKVESTMPEFLKDGWNVGVIRNENVVSGFVGSTIRENIKDGLVFGVQPYGSGSIVYMADNPLFRSFWENGKLLFVNAVFLAGR